jgi:putative ABC transport system permease protein
MVGTWWLLVRQWRSRWGRWVLVVLVVSVAVAPIVGVVVELHSADVARAALGRSLAGPTPLRIVGSTIKGGITPAAVDRIRSLPGVKRVVPTVQAVTEASGTDHPVVVLGVDCSASVLFGDFGCEDPVFATTTAPVAAGPSLVDHMDSGGALQSTNQAVDHGELVPLDRLSDLNHGYSAVTGLARAQMMFGRGDRFDVAYLELDDAASATAVRSRIDRVDGVELRVLDPDDPAPGPDVAGQISGLLGVVGIFGLVVGWLLVRNITRLALAERSREMAIAAAIGRSPSAVLADFALEALLLGLAAAALGLAAGVGVGAILVGSLRELSGRFTGTTMELSIPWSAVAVAAMLGVVMVVAATLPEARRAASANVAEALPPQQAGAVADSPGRPGAVALSLLLTVAGVAAGMVLTGRAGLAGWAQPMALAALLVTVSGAFALAAAGAPFVVALVARALTALPRASLLARSVAGQGRRVTAISLAVSFSVALATVLGGLVPAMRDAAYDYTSQNVGARVALNTLPFNDSSLVDAKIGQELIDRVAGVGAAPTSREVFVLTRARPGVEVGVMASERPNFGFEVIEGSPASTALAEGTAVVGAPLARALGIGVGDHLQLDAPDGVAPIVVGAVSENINNAGLVVVVPWEFLEANWGWQPPDPLLVGEFAMPLGKGVDGRVAELDPRLRIATASGLAKETSDAVASYLAPFELLRDVLLAVVAVAAFTALTMAATQRRSEFGLLTALGLEPDQLRSVALAEAALVSAVGAVLGVLIGLALVEPLRNTASFVVGVRPPFRVGLPAALVAALTAVAATLLASILPARKLRHLDTSAVLRGD